MGWVALPELVAATSNAGAFGFLALATAGPKEAIEMMDQTLSLTDKPFGVNFHMFQPGADEIQDPQHQITLKLSSNKELYAYLQWARLNMRLKLSSLVPTH